MDRPSLQVETYAGYKGEPTPRAFIHEEGRREITRVVATWDTEQHCYFRVQADDARCYVMRYDFDHDRWELVMRER